MTKRVEVDEPAITVSVEEEGGRKIRRYYFDYSTASKAISGLCARRVSAPPLEDAVLPAIFEVLFDHAWIAQRVRSYVEGLSQVRNIKDESNVLTTEQQDITRRLKRVHKTSGPPQRRRP